MQGRVLGMGSMLPTLLRASTPSTAPFFYKINEEPLCAACKKQTRTSFKASKMLPHERRGEGPQYPDSSPSSSCTQLPCAFML